MSSGRAKPICGNASGSAGPTNPSLTYQNVTCCWKGTYGDEKARVSLQTPSN